MRHHHCDIAASSRSALMAAGQPACKRGRMQVCSHHAAVVASGSGVMADGHRFTCPYHGAQKDVHVAAARTLQSASVTAARCLQVSTSKSCRPCFGFMAMPAVSRMHCSSTRWPACLCLRQSGRLAGWQYDSSGRLVRATKLKGIKDFNARNQGLPPLTVEQWAHHFTFMKARPMPGASAEECSSVLDFIGAHLRCKLHAAEHCSRGRYTTPHDMRILRLC